MIRGEVTIKRKTWNETRRPNKERWRDHVLQEARNDGVRQGKIERAFVVDEFVENQSPD